MVKFSGGQEIDAWLAQLPVRIQRNIGRRALRRGAIVLADAAKAGVARKSGLTAEGIDVSTRLREGRPTASVKVRGEHAFVGWFLEFGVAPHYISAGESNLSPRKLTQKAEREGTLKIGEALIQGPVLHPGFAPMPFMRPALDTRADAAILAVRDYLRAEMVKDGFRGSGGEGDDE